MNHTMRARALLVHIGNGRHVRIVVVHVMMGHLRMVHHLRHVAARSRQTEMRAHRRHENNATLPKQERKSQQQRYGKQLQHSKVANPVTFELLGCTQYSMSEKAYTNSHFWLSRFGFAAGCEAGLRPAVSLSKIHREPGHHSKQPGYNFLHHRSEVASQYRDRQKEF